MPVWLEIFAEYGKGLAYREGQISLVTRFDHRNTPRLDGHSWRFAS